MQRLREPVLRFGLGGQSFRRTAGRIAQLGPKLLRPIGEERCFMYVKSGEEVRRVELKRCFRRTPVERPTKGVDIRTQETQSTDTG